MSVDDDVNKVKANIKDIYERKRAAVFADCLEFAAIAWNYFISVQMTGTNTPGKFWHNRIGDAASRFFTKAFKRGDVLGWTAAHGVDYGIPLELANNRKNEAIRPIIQRYAGRFFRKVRELF